MALVSVTEYAKLHGKDPGNVRKMLLCGRLSGYKIGKQWVIDEDTQYPKDNRIKNGKYKVYSISELAAMIKPILKKYHAEGATIFGSYARNEAARSSDIDLLVNGGSNFEATDIFCIADELYEVSGKSVDVYEQREISKKSKLYNTIMKEGIQII